MSRLPLRGDHCQCAACSEYFNSTGAFDRHRSAPHGGDRRCLTPAEMLARRMAVSAAGWWVTSVREDAPCGSSRDYRSDSRASGATRVAGTLPEALRNAMVYACP